MNTLAYGADRTAERGHHRLAGEIGENLLSKDDKPVIDQQAAGPVSPLDGTFGPLLALIGKNSAQNVMAADS